MTISNTSTILKSDLDSAYTSLLTNLRSDANTKPATFWVNLNFNNIISTTSSTVSTRNIPIRDNYFLRELCVTTGLHSGTVTVAIDNGALIEEISVDGYVNGGSTNKVERYFSDPHPLQVLLRGSSIAVTVTTTDTSPTSSVQVALGFRSYWRRT